MTSITPLIDAASMSSRVRDYGLNTLSPVVTMVMSGVYATSALALADILRTPDERWVRLSLWLWLMLASVFSMTRQLQFNLMSAHPVSFLLPLQLMFGFVSAASFACLPLSTGGPDGWRYAITLLLFAIPMVVIVPTSLLRRVKLNQFSPDLHGVVQHRLRDIRATFRGLPVSSAIALAAAIFAWATRDMDAVWLWVIVAVNVATSVRLFVLILAETGSFGRFVAEVEKARLTEGAPPPQTSPG
jgi:hypothetical protein